ncbi:hypothetical protein JXO59_02600 [candidate division KSB1 bacterium]|nr:hypothetical protein [candidate division KSB1 bacterium]
MIRRYVPALFFWLFLFAILNRVYSQDTTAVKIVSGSDSVIDSIRIEKKSPTGAMLRSMVLPGWGQFYNNKPWKALLVAGSEIGLTVNIVLQNQWAQDAKTANDRAFYVNNRNLAIWYLAALILYSMADAYVDAHLFDFDESPNLSISPTTIHRLEEGHFAMGIQLVCTF